MKIQDYLHYYINAAQYRLRYVDYKPGEWTVWSMLTPHRYFPIMNDASVGEVQLRLRPLSDFNEDDYRAWIAGYTNVTGKNVDDDQAFQSYYINTIREKGLNAFEVGEGEGEILPHFVVFFCKRGFDLFGLIPAGLAVDATTANQPTQPTGGGEG